MIFRRQMRKLASSAPPLTTAASIWLTATIGIATGTGRLGLAIVGTLLAYIILTAFGWLEHEMIAKDKRPGD